MSDEVDRFLVVLNESLTTLRSMKKEVAGTHENCNISKTIGTSVNGIGALSLIAGLAFPPAAVLGGIYVALGTTTNITTEAIRSGKNVYVFSGLFSATSA